MNQNITSSATLTKYCPNSQCFSNKKVAICLRAPISSRTLLLKYDWAAKYQCGQCQCEWFLCKLCPQQSKQMTTPKDLYNHHYRCHSKHSLNEDLSSHTSNLKNGKRLKPTTEARTCAPSKKVVMINQASEKVATEYDDQLEVNMNSKDDNNSYYVELPSSVGECSSVTSTSHYNITLKKRNIVRK